MQNESNCIVETAAKYFSPQKRIVNGSASTKSPKAAGILKKNVTLQTFFTRTIYSSEFFFSKK